MLFQNRHILCAFYVDRLNVSRVKATNVEYLSNKKILWMLFLHR